MVYGYPMHQVTQNYQIRRNEHFVKCSCGWTEKALTQREALGRFDRHQKMPHRSLMQTGLTDQRKGQS